jgi:hypothetical protein
MNGVIVVPVIYPSKATLEDLVIFLITYVISLLVAMKIAERLFKL